MKNLKNLSKITAVVLLGTLMAFAAKKTVTFEVNGKCGMCETRIETTAKALDGVKSADWDLETKMLTLQYDNKKTSVETVQAALAAVGHDTGNFRAPDAVYKSLPICCHYVRKPLKEVKTVSTEAKSSCYGSEEVATETNTCSEAEKASCGSSCSEE